MRSSEAWSSFWTDEDALKLIDCVFAELENPSEKMYKAMIDAMEPDSKTRRWLQEWLPGAFTAAIRAAKQG
jgi:hypothetical protein